MKPLNADTWKTILVIVTGLVIMRFVFKTDILLYVAIGIGVVSFLIPVAAQLIQTGWMKLGEILGMVNSRIILGAIFFLILTPIALIYRLTGKDALRLKKGKYNSLYTERNHTFEKKDIENAW